MRRISRPRAWQRLACGPAGTPRRPRRQHYVNDEQRQVVWQLPHSAYGEAQPSGPLQPTTDAKTSYTHTPQLLKTSAPVIELNLRFPGQYYDDESKLHYNYHRSYWAVQGRYTQPDPIGLEGGWNRWGYADGNPVMYTDPLGLRSNGPPARGTYYPRGTGPQPPMFPRSDNTSQAAGYFNPDGSWTCLKWNCPANPGSCGPNDLKSSTDFMPPQTNPMSPPSGCTCEGGPNWKRDFGLPRPYGPGVVDAARDLADLYNTLRPILKPR